MNRHPFDQPCESIPDHPRWQHILDSLTIAATVPLLLWASTHPVAGAIALTTIFSLLIAIRRAVRVTPRFYDREEFGFDVGTSVRITITTTTPCE